MKTKVLLLTLVFNVCLLAAFGQVRSVTGKVTSADDGAPIPDVAVRLKGAIAATTTNDEGFYSIEVDRRSSDVLIFVHPHFDDIELNLNSRDGLDVAMTRNQRVNQYGVPVDRRGLEAEERSGILVFESPDQDYRFWFDLRVQIDGAFFWGETFNPIGNGFEVRRARFAVKAELPGNWMAELDMDFADALADLKDAYLKYSFSPNTYIRVGNFKERFSMETNTTSRYLTFMERPTVTRTLTPSRHLGIQASYGYGGLLAVGGLHFQKVGDFEAVQARKDNNNAFGKSEGYSLTGKLTAMPFYKDMKKGLHIAVAGSYRTPTLDDRIDHVRFDSRSFGNINRKKYLDTDRFQVDDYVLSNLELAGYMNGMKLQGEYTMAKLNRPDDLGTENFSGFYVMGSYLLFGGHHLYNTNDGEFTQAMPGRPWGDIEIAARYEYLDLNSRMEGIMGGAGEAMVFAVNYYAKDNVKLAINYAMANHDRFANGRNRLFVGTDADGNLTANPALVTEGKGKAGESYHAITLRVEVAF